MPLAFSAVMRKNPKIIKIAKSYVKEIKYLQVLIFAEKRFFLTSSASAVKNLRSSVIIDGACGSFSLLSSIPSILPPLRPSPPA